MRSCALVLMLFAGGVAAHGETAREREAFEFLRTATVLDSPYINIGGQHGRAYLALRIVNRSADADALFKRLIDEGATAGKLYGLIGVYRTDRMHLRWVARRFASSLDTVSTMVDGCTMGRKRVAEIFTVDHALTVRDGETLAKAVKRQPLVEGMDIAHGGYTAWLLGPAPDEEKVLREEAAVDFGRH